MARRRLPAPQQATATFPSALLFSATEALAAYALTLMFAGAFYSYSWDYDTAATPVLVAGNVAAAVVLLAALAIREADRGTRESDLGRWAPLAGRVGLSVAVALVTGNGMVRFVFGGVGGCKGVRQEGLGGERRQKTWTVGGPWRMECGHGTWKGCGWLVRTGVACLAECWRNGLLPSEAAAAAAPPLRRRPCVGVVCANRLVEAVLHVNVRVARAALLCPPTPPL